MAGELDRFFFFLTQHLDHQHGKEKTRSGYDTAATTHWSAEIYVSRGLEYIHCVRAEHRLRRWSPENSLFERKQSPVDRHHVVRYRQRLAADHVNMHQEET